MRRDLETEARLFTQEPFPNYRKFDVSDALLNRDDSLRRCRIVGRITDDHD